MEDSEIFENLMNVLAEYGEEVKRLYQSRLMADDKLATGNLINNVETFIAYKGTEFVVYLRLEDYWKYVEKGIAPAGKYKNPGWKAYPFILKWVEVRRILPRPKNGKLPSTQNLDTLYRQSAYLATKKIVEKGIEPGNQLQESVQAINNKYLPLLQEALDKDFNEYAISIYNDINKMIKI